MIALLKAALKRTPLYPVLASYAFYARANRQGTQEARMADFYRQFLRPNDLVFDIGANMGGRVNVFVHLGCRVVAVEPQALCLAVLKRKFGRRINIWPGAISDFIGRAELYVSDIHTLSSMSKEWIKRTAESGRFFSQSDKTVLVDTTTLDALCKSYGPPAFVKIDVEGHEQAVFRGLSCPIRSLSFEFATECMEATFSCLAHLNHLGSYEYNYSFGETMELHFTEWKSMSEIQSSLSRVDPLAWGDIYARLRPHPGSVNS